MADLSAYQDNTTVLEPSEMSADTFPDGIGPGSHLLINMAGGTFGCTANFIWKQGSRRFLGSAGHCFVAPGKTATHGPGADYNPALTTVRVCLSGCRFGGDSGFFLTGTLVSLGSPVYARREGVGSDFGVVAIPASLHSFIRPSLPVFGGPTSTATTIARQPVCHYGNGVLVGETFATMARMGTGVSFGSSSWTAAAVAASGDSGSPLELCAVGENEINGTGAVGILTHVLGAGAGFTIGPLSFGTTVGKAITMSTEAGLSLQLFTV